MSKWYGAIGFAETEETEPGVWRSVVTEKSYFGDVISNRWNRQVSSNSTNDDINISNSISIVADPYAVDNCSKMIYVEFMNTKWKISNFIFRRMGKSYGYDIDKLSKKQSTNFI